MNVMKPTDFSKYLTAFLANYLPHERGASTNTITAYRDTFVLFIKFMEINGVKVNCLTIEKITKELVIAFLEWLEAERHCSSSTRNLRLASIHSFFRYIQYQHPENLFECQKILSIKVKKIKHVPMTYLSIDGIALLLQQPDLSTTRGRRDLALLSLMYDTGARVQEIIDLSSSKIRLDKPTTIRITGKGNKTRVVPMLTDQVRLLKNYMQEHNLIEPHAGMYPLFCNCRKEKLTRAGVNHILLKYVKMAKEMNPKLIPEKISCHSLRHSKAMHLLQAGVNLVYIRDILGHVSVQTTEVYARADSRQKREALEKAYVDVQPKQGAMWLANGNLLDWLKSL